MRTIATLAALFCLLGAAIAQGDPAVRTITAVGSGQVAVKPADRNSNEAIRVADDAARRAAIPQAIADARVEAQAIAQAAGLTLGAIQALSEDSGNPQGNFGPPIGFFGPFGPSRFCGKVSRPILGPARPGHRRKLVRFERRRRCFVPPFAVVRLSVTFAAS